MTWSIWTVLPFLLLSYSTPIKCNNIGPSIDISSSFNFDQEIQEIRETYQFPVDHPFFENHEKPFSWHDVEAKLWQGRHPKASKERALTKRAPTTIVGDAVFKLPSCLGCMKAQTLGTTASLDTLTRVFLQQQILIPTGQLQDRCVFYTGVQDYVDYAKRAFLPGAAEHPSKSESQSFIVQCQYSSAFCYPDCRGQDGRTLAWNQELTSMQTYLSSQPTGLVVTAKSQSGYVDTNNGFSTSYN